ncbi:MAG TPA: hypothetical protein VI796_02970 [Candidatus Thermoplasmatota archaeon]|nr:hypothetical protein [Candidatus Thermoplasmatota archaeon]
MSPKGSALSILVLLLSGCSGGGGDGAGDDEVAAMGLEPPVWEVGDWWNYTSDQIGLFTVVVTGETATDWFLDTDNQGLAFSNALYDLSLLGEIRKSDFAGSQGSDRPEYFQWPLVDGATWPLELDSQQLTVTATDEGEGLFLLEARNETGLYMSYTYDGNVGWLRDLVFYNLDGSESFAVHPADAGHGYVGSYDRWTLEEVVAAEGDLATDPMTFGNFEVPLDVTDVFVFFTLDCTAGTATSGAAPAPYVAELNGGRGAGYAPGPCPIQDGGGYVAGSPQPDPDGGGDNWTWGYGGSPASSGSYSLQVLLRTLTAATLSTA